MAGEDKTEEPTAKRLSEARNRGQIPVSRELIVAIGLVSLMGVLYFAGGALLSGYYRLMRAGLDITSTPGQEPMLLLGRMVDLFELSIPLLLIPVVGVGVISIVVGLLQTQFNFALEALKPSFQKLNPIEGLKRLLGYRGLFEVGKELLKITVVLFAAYLVLWPQRDQLAKLVGLPPLDTLGYLAALVLKLGFAVAGAYVLLAIVDVLFQRFSNKRELRMTREEVKQEARQTDLSPEVKGFLRQRQMETSRRRMLSEVPEADVVITNPTHFAVALKYSPDQPAPRMVASGGDLIAAQIRRIAEESDVPIVENPPLARALFDACEPGDWLPEKFYIAVAEILAFVYRSRRKSGLSLEV